MTDLLDFVFVLSVCALAISTVAGLVLLAVALVDWIGGPERPLFTQEQIAHRDLYGSLTPNPHGLRGHDRETA